MQNCTALVTVLKPNVITIKRYALLYSDADLCCAMTGLNQTLELSELTRQQLEEEIQSLNREKQEVSAQLSMVGLFLLLSCCVNEF